MNSHEKARPVKAPASYWRSSIPALFRTFAGWERGAAGDFYSGLFGWEIQPIEDDGIVVYTTIKNAGKQNGGFMPMTEQHGDAPSFWLPYFTVSSRDAAMEKARELGGTALAGPLDLPSGKIAVLGDPQGAAFAVFEGETDE